MYLPKKEFEKVNATLPEDEKAANPRNLAAGTVRRQKSQEAARIPLDMYCYEGFWGDEESTPKDHLHIMKKLSDLGFRINPDFAFFSRTKEEAEEKLKEAGLEGTGYGFSDIKEYISIMTEKRPGLDHEIDGLVFRSEDPTALAEKIRWCILHQDQLAEMGDRAREIYNRYFTMDIFHKNLISVVKEVFTE